MKNLKVLFVTSSHRELGDTGKKTGVWLEEIASPYYVFKDQGAEIVVASPEGGVMPIDPTSQKPDSQTESTKRFMDDDEARELINNTQKLADIDPSEFDAVFFPGGHAPMWDLGDNPQVADIITAFDKENKPIGLVCHGVVALKGVEAEDGQPFVKGKKVTAFSNSEEEAAGLTDVVPFLLEDVLSEAGAIYRKGDDWTDFVVKDGNLVTGQNPQSSETAAEKVLENISVTSA